MRDDRLRRCYEIDAARCGFRCECFFLEFKQRLIDSFPELFGEDCGGFDSNAQFGRRWGWYASLYAIAGGSLLNFEAAAKINIYECLTFLTFEKEKNEMEIKMLKK